MVNKADYSIHESTSCVELHIEKPECRLCGDASLGGLLTWCALDKTTVHLSNISETHHHFSLVFGDTLLTAR